MKKSSSSSTRTTWRYAKVPNLYQHPKGVYYARYRVGKQDVWRSLRTTVKSVAVHELTQLLDSVAVRRASGLAPVEGAMRFKDAQELYLKTFLADATVAENTKRLRANGFGHLNRSWPELAETSVRKITSKQIAAWFKQLSDSAQPYVPRGANRAVRRSTGRSATTLNSALDSLRLALDLAVLEGYIPVNPGRHLLVKRVTPTQKELKLPKRTEFVQMVEAIRKSGTQHCYNAADMVVFLALTGARVGQARLVCWCDVDFETGMLALQKSKRTPKREVPMCEELIQFLRQLQSERQDSERASDQSVLRIKECLGFLESACEKINVEKLTHHDLRHLFATTAMEQNIDPSTVAALLGHKDGGVLAMKVYGHNRADHMKSAVKKINFGLKSQG